MAILQAVPCSPFTAVTLPAIREPWGYCALSQRLYAQSILNHHRCNTHTHTFLTKGRLCICQGHRSNKGEVRGSVLCCDELCRLQACTSSPHKHPRSILPPLICCFVCMLKQILSLLDWAKYVLGHTWIETEVRWEEWGEKKEIGFSLRLWVTCREIIQKGTKKYQEGYKGYIIHPNLTVLKCLGFCHLPH